MSSWMFMPNKRKRIFALLGLTGIIGLSAAYFLLPWLLLFLEQNRQVIKQLRAWTMGARFVTDKGVVLQSTTNDCGPASLKTILASYGIDPSVSNLSPHLRLPPNGISMLDLREISMKLGLEAKSWFIHPKDLPSVPLPAIAFVNKNHFVVVRRFIAPDVLEVDDPALGRIQWPSRAFEKVWSGEMLVFDPAWTPL
jgi:predicted double-glycine peptidase